MNISGLCPSNNSSSRFLWTMAEKTKKIYRYTLLFVATVNTARSLYNELQPATLLTVVWLAGGASVR